MRDVRTRESTMSASTVIDSTVIDSTVIDSTVIDSTMIDSTMIDSMMIESTTVGPLAGNGSAALAHGRAAASPDNVANSMQENRLPWSKLS